MRLTRLRSHGPRWSEKAVVECIDNITALLHLWRKQKPPFHPAICDIELALIQVQSSHPQDDLPTCKLTPLTWPLSTGLASTATCRATSAGLPTFCKGVVASALSTNFLSSNVFSARGVATQPGLTLLTRPWGAMETISFFNVGVKPYMRADFAAA